MKACVWLGEVRACIDYVVSVDLVQIKHLFPPIILHDMIGPSRSMPILSLMMVLFEKGPLVSMIHPKMKALLVTMHNTRTTIIL